MKFLDNIKEVYGPYTRKSDGRQIVVLCYLDGTKSSRSYPKYLKELELGRELDNDLETIDHKDRNYLDNSPENTQVLTRAENSAKSALRRKAVFAECPTCSEVFELTRDQIASRQCGRVTSPPFCSKSCSSKYHSLVRKGLKPKLNSFSLEVDYFRLDDQ